ncbi:hypothetical protein PMIN03_009062 [Paraphaeosphaeria minitans]
MLSLVEFAMIPIPLIFYRYGHRIRERSTLIRQMCEDKEKLDTKMRTREVTVLNEKEKLEV